MGKILFSRSGSQRRKYQSRRLQRDEDGRLADGKFMADVSEGDRVCNARCSEPKPNQSKICHMNNFLPYSCLPEGTPIMVALLQTLSNGNKVFRNTFKVVSDIEETIDTLSSSVM